MKFLFNIFFFLLGSVIGLLLIFIYFNLGSKKESTNPLPDIGNIISSTLSNFSIVKPPSDSLIGKIDSFSGDVEWQGRTATESSQVKSLIDIQQGESVSTNNTGKASVSFENNLEVNISPNSEVDFIQTLPQDLVMTQASGIVEYKKLGSLPVSVRAMHLLVEDVGNMTLSINTLKSLVTIKVESGSVTIAYNNLLNISKVLTVQKGKTLIFNDRTRRVIVR